MSKVIGSNALVDRVRVLAQFITEKKNRSKKFVLMLGAGASLSSGIKMTKTIMEEVVRAYAPQSGETVEDAFDQLNPIRTTASSCWRRT
jgi:NAD-dependent SIR2 family protein deacetylase